MELYIKAGPDGCSVGDCPFAHFVRAVVAYKGQDCKVIPCTRDTKPPWLVSDHAGKMPCLKYKEDIITESSAIADYLDKTFPEPPFLGGAAVEQVCSTISGFFPAMARFVKTVEFRPELEEALLAELAKLENILAESSGDYLCGGTLSLADLSLAPKLFHLKTTLMEFSPTTWEKVRVFTKLCSYLETMLATPCISGTCYPAEVVVWGWGQARQ